MPVSLGLPENLYFHRYLFLKISSLAHRAPRPFQSLVPQILTELHGSGLFRRVSAYIWESKHIGPSQFHAGEAPVHCPEDHLLRADWALGEVSVSILAAPPGKAGTQTEADTQLLGFVSQQIAQLAHAETVRFANSSLQAEIKELSETLTLGKLLDRAVSLLVAKLRISPAAAEATLLRASEEHGKPLIDIAQQIVLDLGSPALSSRRGRTPANAAAA
jgi:ANTAR domain